MNQPSKPSLTDSPTIFGHPAGLFTLFFAEMWERFSYYGMRALLVFYMTKGFLGYGDKDAYAVYGAYTALVYMTPFFGGLLADRLLGQRRAVIFGGLLMARPFADGRGLEFRDPDWRPIDFLVERRTVFFAALGPVDLRQRVLQAEHLHDRRLTLRSRQSATRRRLHDLLHGREPGSGDRSLVVRLHRREYDWHLGFGLATVGMLVGTAIFVVPRAATQILILTSFSGRVGDAEISPRQFPLHRHEHLCRRGALHFGDRGHSGPGPRRRSP